MKRILFVDDEKRVLDGLRRLLRGQRKEWEMVFAQSGREALELVEAAPFDVVVSDMRMPEMDGAELLSRIERIHPETVRIVLSGHSELDSLLRAARSAHQFLSKPCDGKALVDTVQRACLLQGLLRNPRLLQIAGELEPLPALPQTYQALTEALERPDVSLPEVADIVARDPAVCAKLLRFVNSSFFGLKQPISDPHHAVSFLGVQALRNLILSLELFEAREGEPSMVDAAFLGRLQDHSVRVGALARRLCGGGAVGNDAFVAGMLHDLGLLVLAAREPDLLKNLLREAEESGRPLAEIEVEQLGVSHAELGAYLLGLWGLPGDIVEAVAHHHEPLRVEHDGVDAIVAVHVAELLLAERQPVLGGEGVAGRVSPAERLEALGLSDRLEAWSALADEVAANGWKP